MWRDVPPGRNWIPGEWQQVDNGYQWVPGFWADGKQEQAQLLPVPPDSLEAGPSSPSPGDNYLWAPGNWAYQNNQYVWQAGYWYRRESQLGVGAQSLLLCAARQRLCQWVLGLLALKSRIAVRPCLLGQRLPRRLRLGKAIIVRAALSTQVLLIANLFVNRGYGHYYYGNYGSNYPGWLQPWGYNYGRYGYRGGNQFGYDPMWSYFRWSNRRQLGQQLLEQSQQLEPAWRRMEPVELGWPTRGNWDGRMESQW